MSLFLNLCAASPAFRNLSGVLHWLQMLRELDVLTSLTYAIDRYSLNPSVRRALDVAKILWDWGDAVSAEIKRELKNQHYSTDCSAGCFYCCHQNVQITPYEIIGIIDWARNHLEPSMIQTMQKSAEKAAAKMKNDRLDTERWQRRDSCPCLDKNSGECLIYAVRPLYCRTTISISRRKCEQCYMDVSTHNIDIPIPVDVSLPPVPSDQKLDTFQKYVAIVLAEASSKYWRKLAREKMPMRFGRQITSAVIYRIVSLHNLELTKSISFAFGGDIDRNLKSLLRLKESEVNACYKCTEPE